MKISLIWRWLLIVNIVQNPVQAALPVFIGGGASSSVVGGSAPSNVGTTSIQFSAPSSAPVRSYTYRNGGSGDRSNVHTVSPGGGPPVRYDANFFSRPADGASVPVSHPVYEQGPANPNPFQLCIRRDGQETCNWHTPR